MRRARFVSTHGVLAISASSLGLEFVIVGPASDPFTLSGSTATVTVRGPLLQHCDPLWDSYEAIRGRVEAALASTASSIVLKIDSPGGEVAGCFELARELRAMASVSGKSIVSYIDGMACSAAYALACSADRICIPPSGIVGSIGCLKVAVDQTAMNAAMGLAFTVVTSGSRKGDGNPLVRATDGMVAAFQTEVDDMAGLFASLVADARHSSPEAILGLEAATFVGSKALGAGLADEITTFETLLGSLAVPSATANAARGDTMTDREQALVALRAIAAGEDEDQAKSAKAALAAMGEGHDEAPKDEDKEKKDDDSKAEDDAPPAKDDAPKKDDDSKALASLSLAATVQSLTARLDAKEALEERTRLMASRPDFASEVVSFLSKQPLSTVRDAVKSLPKGAMPARGQVAAARAATTVQATVGATQVGGGDRLPPEEAHELDVRMGLSSRTKGVRLVGNELVLGVMTPAEARATLARRSVK